MKYQAIAQHRSEFPNPITMRKGDKLIIGEKSDEHEAWNDWYCCETQDGNSGWVPKQIIKWLSDSEGEALEDYTAKELNVDEGQTLLGTKTLNGWIWCQHLVTEEEGWVPAENLVQV